MAVNEERKNWVESQLKSRGMEATAANRKMLRQEYDGLQNQTDLTESAINAIREIFPAYAYLVEDNAGGFGADVRGIIVKAVLQDYSANRLLGELQGTPYFQTTSANQRSFDGLKAGDKDARVATYQETIVNQYGRGQLDDTQLKDIATKAARNGLQGIQLQNFVFSQYLNTAKKAGQQAAEMSGQQMNQIKTLGQKYFVKPSQDDINSVMTGSVGITDLENRYKMDAKSLYPHLSDLIDSGSSLQDISRPYVRAAAEVLGTTEDQIDMVSPSSKYRMALENVSGDGGPRRMTLTEWIKTLRTDTNFGYQYTQQANQDATNIALTIARAFGKMM